MIPFDRIDSMMMPLEERMELFYMRTLTDSSRSLSTLLRAINGLNPATFYAHKYLAADKLYDSIVTRIAKLSGYTEKELRLIFKRAGFESMKDDAAMIGKLGLEVPELATSDVLTGAVNAVFARTNVVLQNLTRSIAYQSEMAFIAAADDAFLAVATGTMSIDQAIKQGVLNMAEQGVKVLNSQTGRVEQADVAIKRNVWTGINQATGDMTLQLANEVGTDYVEVSAHPGARNTGVGVANHEGWQGKVYSISGRDPKYAPFRETTGYGTGAGLLGYNCRHSLFLFFPGFEQPKYTQEELNRVNNTQVTYNGQEMDLYSATQQQRYLERGVRDWKRRAAMFEAAGLGEEHQMAGVKISDWQDKLRDFTNKTGLQRRYEWEQVAGVRAQRPAWGKTVGGKPVAPKPKYDMNTYDGVMARLQDVVGFTNGMPDLSMLDMQTVKDIAGQYEKVVNKYPQMKGKFDSLNVKYMDKKNYAQSWQGDIELSKDKFINYLETNKSYELDISSGFHPVGTNSKSIITHEIGHVVSNKLPKIVTPFSLMGTPESAYDAMSRQITREFNIDYSKDIANGLSQYATRNSKEFFAEAFAEYMDSPNPRAIAKRFGELLDEWMKDIK